MRDLSIIQWGRLGDLIQTGIVMERWRRLGGNCNLYFDSRFLDLLKSFNHDFNLFPVDLKRIVAEVRNSTSLAAALASLRNYCREVSASQDHSHLVLSRSKPAALFSILHEPASQLGFSWSAGALQEPRLMTEYLRGNGVNRPLPVHICDIWCLLAGLRTDSSTGYREAWNKDEGAINERTGILLFADAGETARTPPLAWLAKLACRLKQVSQQPVRIVGARRGAQSDEIGSLISAPTCGFEDLRGETDLSSLAELCRGSRIALGADTGGLHLAAACGCQVIGFYCGGASALNTGPYHRSAVIAHDLSWTEEEIHDVNRELEACLMQQRPSGSRAKSINWCRPAWDSLGILYLPDTISRSQLSRLIAVRMELMGCWFPELLANANSVKDNAVDQLERI